MATTIKPSSCTEKDIFKMCGRSLMCIPEVIWTKFSLVIYLIKYIFSPERLRVVFSDPHPPEWNALDLAHDFELVELEETLKEFIGVKTAFFAKLDEKSKKICKIYRIQNLALWNEYKM